MKTFIVSPIMNPPHVYRWYPWFAFGKSAAEVKARFPGCIVEEDV
jgi:hypothetical protein